MSLIASVSGNGLSEMKRLLAEGADVNAVDRYGCTALWYAANEGQVECATALIDAKADVDKANKYGWTPLHRASQKGHTDCIRLLIEHKANVNALDSSEYSPLHLASLNGRLACVQILVTTGAERDRPGNSGYTPFALAMKWDHCNVAEFLLHSGAKIENMCRYIEISYWMADIIAKRRNVMSFTLVLKGVLKRRFGISKDATHLIALYFWRMRLHNV